MLLGLDVEGTMQVTHSFGNLPKEIPQQGETREKHEQDDVQKNIDYQLEMQRQLRQVQVDVNTIGWYQTSHLGQFLSTSNIEIQYAYQREIPNSILLVYDSLQAAIGKPSFKALRLSQAFMDRFDPSAPQQGLVDFQRSQ